MDPLKLILDPLKPRFHTFQGSMDPCHMEPGANPVFDSKLTCVEIWKKLSILWYTKFQLITVKYHEKHFFVKCPPMWKNWALYTQNANTRSQFRVQILR